MQDSPASEIFTTRRIAIVEGDRPTAEMLHTFFRLMDLEPSLIDPGPAAVPTIRRLQPHVLLLDLELPDLRALDIANQLDAVVPIIYLSAGDKPRGFEDLLSLFERVLEV